MIQPCSLNRQGGRRRGSLGLGSPWMWLRVVGTSITILPPKLRRTVFWRTGSRGEDES